MGLFDLPAPLFAAIDSVLALLLPVFVRLTVWGVLAGLLTMLLYRRFSNQTRIAELKTQQKLQQKLMAEFEGEFNELMPLIGSTLALGFRQLRLALGPALLASIPILFLVIWVAGEFAFQSPTAGDIIDFSAAPVMDDRYYWSPSGGIENGESGWLVTWPEADGSLELTLGEQVVLSLPLADNIGVIHKQQWWNILMANPLGYLPDDSNIDQITLGLPAVEALPFGPQWVRGWMFTFFLVFFASSIAFKFILKIE